MCSHATTGTTEQKHSDRLDSSCKDNSERPEQQLVHFWQLLRLGQILAAHVERCRCCEDAAVARNVVALRAMRLSSSSKPKRNVGKDSSTINHISTVTVLATDVDAGRKCTTVSKALYIPRYIFHVRQNKVLRLNNWNDEYQVYLNRNAAVLRGDLMQQASQSQPMCPPLHQRAHRAWIAEINAGFQKAG